MDRALRWLSYHQRNRLAKLKEGDVRSADVYVALALSNVNANAGGNDSTQRRTLEILFEKREFLSMYGKIILGLTIQKQNGLSADWESNLTILVRGISQYLEEDTENNTAYLRLSPNRSWWFWYEDEVETQASFLKLLSLVQPENPTNLRLARYLLNNRQHANYWKSTRDTSVAIDALITYTETSEAESAKGNVSVTFNGEKVSSRYFTGTEFLEKPEKVILSHGDLASGKHIVSVEKDSGFSLFYGGNLNYFSLEDAISSAGVEIKVHRYLYRKCNAAGLSESKAHSCRSLIRSGEIIQSGEEIEVELIVESKNHYEYILVEDMKASGFEALDSESGYVGGALGAYVEYRDNRVSFFIEKLYPGKHKLMYKLKAEIPGLFSALPAKVEAIYSPQLRANSDEMRLEVIDNLR